MRTLVRTITLAFIANTAIAQSGLEVGEWALDLESCADARLLFTAEGQHEARMFDDGKWVLLATAPYRREVDEIIISIDGLEEKLVILDESNDRLVYRNTDEQRMKAIGVESVELLRCQ